MASPRVVWVRVTPNLRHVCRQAVAVAGSRAASAYGRHMAAGITTGLAAGGWMIVSGGS